MRSVPMRLCAQVALMGQEVRDAVGTLLLRLTLRELFQWRFMQTDPNWGNFMNDAHSGVLNLIDFGARRAPAWPPLPRTLPVRDATCTSCMAGPAARLRPWALPWPPWSVQ